MASKRPNSLVYPSLLAFVILACLTMSAALSTSLGAQAPGIGVFDRPDTALPPGWSIAPIGEPTVVPALPEDASAGPRSYADASEVAPGDGGPTWPVAAVLRGSPYRLSFVNGDFSPAKSERIDPRMLDYFAANGVTHTWGYVMFEGAVQQRKIAALEALGLVFLTPQPFNSIQAWIPRESLGALRASPYVRWVGYAKPHQKICPTIAAKLEDVDVSENEALPVFVHAFESDLGPWSKEVPFDDAPTPGSNVDRLKTMPAMITKSNGPIQRMIEDAGGVVYAYEDILNCFFVWANKATIRRLCDLDIIAGMDFARTPVLLDDRAGRMTGEDYLGASASFNGKDTAVAIVDSGLHKQHLDFFAKYVLSWDYSGENNAAVDNCGHGTNVAGTFFSHGGARVDRRYRGAAPMTGSVPENTILSIKVTRGDCSVDTNIWPNTGLLAWSRTVLNYPAWNTTTNKATVVNNSWGYPTPNQNTTAGTDTLSRGVDSYTHTHRQLHVIAAGNRGGNASQQNYGTVDAPASSKSALTVGNLMDYDDTSNPITGGRYPGAAAYSSSKGPTSDGRMKPEIAAPGNMNTSAQSNSLIGYSDYGGTSAAAPHVSGIAASLQDNSSNYRNYPCLVRAKMMASAAPYGGFRSTTQSSESSYNRRGMGQVDAVHTVYQNDTPGGWKSGSYVRSLTRSSGGFYFDVAIPADATRTTFVMSWDEKPSALNASTPILYDLDVVLDVEPFSANINSGEYSSRRKDVNHDFYQNIATISAIRGKTVRVKIPFLTKPSSASEIVRVAVAYHIPRGDYTPNLSLNLSGVPTVMRPSTDFTLTATVDTNDYRANNVYGEISAPVGTVRGLSHTTRDGRSLDTDGLSPNTDSMRDWTLGNVDVLWNLTSRQLRWAMRAPSTSGVSTITVTARSDNAANAIRSVNLCVDGLAPNAPPRLISTTHQTNQWTNQLNFGAQWNAASDNGCAGVLGYGVSVGTSCMTPPATTQGVVTTFSQPFVGGTGTAYHVSVRTFDRANNGSQTACLGPYLIDTAAPSGSIRIAKSEVTTLQVVNLTLAATDPGSGSGLASMQFSNDGTTWSRTVPYATTYAGWTLAKGAPGLRTVWARFIDAAGNRSNAVRDSITWNPFTVRAVTPNRGPLIGGDSVKVTGTGFTSATPTVWFGSTRATNVVVESDQTLSCTTPTNLTPSEVTVRVGTASLTGGLADAYEYVGARVTASGNPRVGIPFPLTFEALVDNGRTYVAAASLAAGTIPLDPHNPLGLAPDALFFLVADGSLPTVFPGFRGVIGAGGTASGSIVAPADNLLVGVDLFVGFITLDPSKPLGIRSVSSVSRFRIAQ